MFHAIMPFQISGAVKDNGYILKKQAWEEKRLKLKMFREGYLPVLDITPILGIEYDQKKEIFFYTITIYGILCEESIEDYEGWLSGRWIKSTTRTRLGRLSKKLESE